MSSNGHNRDILKVNGDGLPKSLRLFMLEHFADLDEPIRIPSADSPRMSADTAESEKAAIVKVMLEQGCTHQQVLEALSVLVKMSADKPIVSEDVPRTSKAEKILEDRKRRDNERKKKKRAADKEGAADVTIHSVAEERPRTLNEGIYIEDSKASNDKKETKEVRGSGIRASEWFDKFWLAYPKRLGGNPRKPAQDQFTIALKNGHDPETIVRGAEGYAEECKKTNIVGTAYVAHARTWLRQQRWNDYQQKTLAAADFNSEEYQAARRRALDAIKGT